MKKILKLNLALAYIFSAVIFSGGIAKADSNLPEYRFTKTTGVTAPNGASNAVATATDANNNQYVVHIWAGTVTFDPQENKDTFTNGNLQGFNPSCALTKYDSKGNYLWTKTIVGLDTESGALCTSVAISADGKVYIGGDGINNVGFGNQAYYNGYTYGFIATFDEDGNYIKTNFITQNSNVNFLNFVVSLAVDSSNNLYATGDVAGTVSFNGLGGSNNQTFTKYTGFISKYNSNGDWQQTVTDSFDSSDSNLVGAIKIDSNNDIYVCGSHVAPAPSSNADEGYISKYDSSLNLLNIKYISANSNSGVTCNSIAVDGNNLYVGGSYYGSVVFDGRNGTDIVDDSTNASNSMNTNSYILKYSSDGSYSWVRTIKNSDNNSYSSVKSLQYWNGEIYAVGSWTGTVKFNPLNNASGQSQVNNSGFFSGYLVDGTYKFTKIVNASADNTSAYHLASSIDKIGNMNIVGYGGGTPVFDSTNPASAIAIGDASGMQGSTIESYFLGLPNEKPKTPDTGMGEFTKIFNSNLIISGSLLFFILLGSFMIAKNLLRKN